MQKHILKVFLFITFVCFQTQVFYAQDTLGTLTIIGTGAFRPTVADANKINENPVVNDSTQKLQVKSYSINSQRINTNFDVAPIAAAQMVGEPLTKLYNALVKIGFGNYTTPYGEVWYNSLRSKEYAYGVHMKHLSSTYTAKDYGFAGLSDNEINLNGKKFLKEHTLSGNFDYARNVVHFYGYDVVNNSLNKDATAQRFNYFGANAELMSHYSKEERYNHEVKLSYYNIADLYKASENNIKAEGFVKTTIQKEVIKVNAAVEYFNNKTMKDTVNNTNITINPNVYAKGEKYTAAVGLTATMDNEDGTKFYFYPKIDLSYNVVENIIVPYIGASGGLHKNSLKEITDQNPFVLSELQLKSTNNRYQLFGGIKGTVTSNIDYDASASYTSMYNMAMYVNDTKNLLANRFDVIYDDGEELHVHGEMAYQLREKIRIHLSGDYFNYKMKTEMRAWYLPQLKFALGGNYNISDKIIVRADFFYLDNQYAKTIENAGTHQEKVEATQLKGMFDANIGGEYRYNKKLGFFINVNNIANVRYYRYSNYPTQRFNAMLGLSYSF